MRPHEETWVRLAGGGGPGVAIRTVDPRGGPGEFVGALETPERSKLAAQAPAMARLWIKHQWAGLDDCGTPQCPECEQYEPGTLRPRSSLEGHKPDCAIYQALRDAGVLP